jgi:hypothetical protein
MNTGMELVSGLALVLLTLVGYSSGAVLGAPRRTPVPALLDLAVVLSLWVVALVTRPELGKWGAIGAWLVVGILDGAVLSRARAGRYPKAKTGAPAASLWQAWKGFARRMGNYQSRMLMAYLYFTLVLPFGLGVALLSDPLRLKPGAAESNWRPKQLPVKPSPGEAGRQY